VQAEPGGPRGGDAPTFCSANALYWLRASVVITVPHARHSPPYYSNPRRRAASCSPDSIRPPAFDRPGSPDEQSQRRVRDHGAEGQYRSRVEPHKPTANRYWLDWKRCAGAVIVVPFVTTPRPARGWPCRREATAHQAIVRACPRSDVHAGDVVAIGVGVLGIVGVGVAVATAARGQVAVGTGVLVSTGVLVGIAVSVTVGEVVGATVSVAVGVTV